MPMYLLRSIRVFILNLKFRSHGILHYLWSADLLKGSKSFSQLIVSIFTFLNQQIFSIVFSQQIKGVGLLHTAYIVIH